MLPPQHFATIITAGQPASMATATYFLDIPHFFQQRVSVRCERSPRREPPIIDDGLLDIVLSDSSRQKEAPHSFRVRCHFLKLRYLSTHRHGLRRLHDEAPRSWSARDRAPNSPANRPHNPRHRLPRLFRRNEGPRCLNQEEQDQVPLARAEVSRASRNETQEAQEGEIDKAI